MALWVCAQGQVTSVNRYIYEHMLSVLFIVLLLGVIASSAFRQLLKFFVSR